MSAFTMEEEVASRMKDEREVSFIVADYYCLSLRCDVASSKV